MNFKITGGILLIVGTSIGAGILGLPIAAAEVGFLGARILLFSIWALMLAGAFLVLETNLMLPVNTNIISMAKKTIGLPGQIIAWIVYLLLLYSLLCAYISGGSGILSYLLLKMGITLKNGISATLFTLIFGLIVYAGIHVVDKTNRLFIFLKFLTLFVVVLLMVPMVNVENLLSGNLKQLSSITAITVTITSFGWAILIPSLRAYFEDDVVILKKVIIVASIIPLICYLAWDFTIMGILPLSGPDSLQMILKSQNSTGALTHILSERAKNPTTIWFINMFTSVSVLTSFLGVALCLTDFLADGFNIKKKGISNIGLHMLTFIPALLITLLIPGLFIKALKYAGIYCIILLVMLPAWMAYCGRKNMALKPRFQMPGGQATLYLVMIIATILLGFALHDALIK